MSMDHVVCPGCGWTGDSEDLAKDVTTEQGCCPVCGYQPPDGVDSLPTVAEVLTADTMPDYDEVDLSTFVRAVLQVREAAQPEGKAP